MSSVIARVFEKFSRVTGERIHDEKGHEIPDPIPVEPAVGYRAGPTLRDQIREMIQSERLAAEARAAGFETLEEADDFDVGEDYEPNSPYEIDSNLPTIAELNRRKKQAEDAEAASPPKPKKKGSASPDQGDAPLPDPAEPGGSGAPE